MRSPETSRNHTGNAGAGLLALAAVPRPAFAVDTSPKKVRMGVIGGGMGRGFGWHKHPDSTVTAVSDLRPDRRDLLMATYGCQTAYPSLEELVRDPNVDAVAIFTDGPLHVQHVKEAMRHGKHAISAVPACWGTLEQAEELLDVVKTTGLTYMLGETDYYAPYMVSARKYYQQGQFGKILHCEAEYFHDGLEQLYFENGKRTWRHGMPPMWYPTHTVVYLVGLTGERLTHVSCTGWGDVSPVVQDNIHSNPFWNETAWFTSSQGSSFAMRVWWKGPLPDGARASWYGTRMSMITSRIEGARGEKSIIKLRTGDRTIKDEHGFNVTLAQREEHQQEAWAAGDMLPEPLRMKGDLPGHGGTELFLTHEFIDALTHNRRPIVDIYEALAYTVPGIIAHQSALRGGERLKIPQYDPS